MGFKKNFVWGAATAAYQIEGGAFEDGKGLSIWDTFSHTGGKIYSGQNGDCACDHYHRLEENLDIMKKIGLKGYRFSVSWPRIIPNGTGEVNEKGIDFYNRLIDGLIQRGIEPCMTLYHWDMPYSLHLQGGWLNDNSPEWFGEYAALIKERFGDRVHNFITFNEPQVFIGCGYLTGAHAPGYKLGTAEIMRMSHNVLKAHGKAVLALRNGSECKIGFTGASGPAAPVSNSREDIDAARRNYFFSSQQASQQAFVFSDSFWFDPVLKGKYPQWVYDFDEINKPDISDKDMELISQPIDFIGLNIYNGRYISADGEAEKTIPLKDGSAKTAFGWPVTPEVLYWGPYFFYERYKKPIVITENGMSCHDWESVDGKVHDPNRIDYMQRYLRELKKAADDGVDIDGYYTWSLMDNFEWASGYNERFGLVYVDYQTNKRILKDSAYWYNKIIEDNGENL